MAASAVRVTDTDRLTFTVFLALALHAIVVLGVTFAPHKPAPTAQTLDITLSHQDDRKAPKHADFLAQTNQKGSGTLKKKAQITTTRQAPISARQVHKTQPVPREAAPAAQAKPEKRHVITTQSRRAPRHVASQKQPQKAHTHHNHQSLMARSLEIASLEAKLDHEQQEYARRPRVMRVTAASTLKSSDAWYVQSWVDKVTRIGNLNYPEAARRRGIHGTLRLLVALKPNGHVKDVQVLQSSGYKILDQAAVRIVRLAAPFSPFPPELRKRKDILEIIRTWSFEPRGMSSN